MNHVLISNVTSTGPEFNLFLAIVTKAIEELGSSKLSEYTEARNYLKRDIIFHAEMIDIDSDYIRRLLTISEIFNLAERTDHISQSQVTRKRRVNRVSTSTRNKELI